MKSMDSTLISQIWPKYFLLKIFVLKRQLFYIYLCQVLFPVFISFQSQLWDILDKSWQNKIKSQSWTDVHLNVINSVFSSYNMCKKVTAFYSFITFLPPFSLKLISKLPHS